MDPLLLTTNAALSQPLSPCMTRLLTLILRVNKPGGQGVFLDFNDSDSGLQVEKSFPIFIDGFGQLAADNPTPELFLAVVHFTAEV